MKNTIIHSIAALLAFLLAGCTETSEIQPDPAAEQAYVEVSSDKLIFDADGGCTALAVATNATDWNFASEGEWFTVARQGANTLLIEASINGSPTTQTGKLTVSGERNGVRISTAVTLVQRAERSIDLSAEGTSNCYIAQTGKAYKFDASVKGNGKSDGRSDYIARQGVGIEGVAIAELLWEARNDADKTMSRAIIDGAPVFKNGYVAFSTGRAQGNAVIAVKDIDGNILWSWHIWVCDDKITAHDHIGPKKQVVAQIMDRNLGALNNKPMDIDNRGMFYQWGRKDPFMPSCSPYHDDTDGSNIPAYNQTNYETGNGTGSWVFNEKTLPLAIPPGNIPNATLHPMTYLLLYYRDVYNWYCASTAENVSHSRLWGPEKTIFDPCPVGYKVPGKNIWGIPSGNKDLRNGGPAEDYDPSGISSEWDWNASEECGRRWKNTGDYYPMVGNIYYTVEDKSAHNYASAQAFYWTCDETPETDKPNCYRQDFNHLWALYRVSPHVYSAQIRCIKE